MTEPGKDDITKKLVKVLKKSKQELDLSKDLQPEKALNNRFSKKKLKEFTGMVGDEIEANADESFKDKPSWIEKLIEHDANVLDTLTDAEFAKAVGISMRSIFHARRSFPNYALAVAYRQRKYLADFGNFCMKALMKRILQSSDAALKMGLEISGKYTPTQKLIEDSLDPESKRRKIGNLLKDILVEETPKQEERMVTQEVSAEGTQPTQDNGNTGQ